MSISRFAWLFCLSLKLVGELAVCCRLCISISVQILCQNCVLCTSWAELLQRTENRIKSTLALCTKMKCVMSEGKVTILCIVPINTSDKLESFIMWDFLIMRQCYPCMTDCTEEEGKGLTQLMDWKKFSINKFEWQWNTWCMKITLKNWFNKRIWVGW